MSRYNHFAEKCRRLIQRGIESRNRKRKYQSCGSRSSSAQREQQAGLGQNPARQAALGAGLPDKVSAFSVHHVCGSGLKAVMLAAQSIALGDNDIIVEGGMQSMSNAPYLLTKARDGYRMGDGEIIDSMIHDGLWG